MGHSGNLGCASRPSAVLVVWGGSREEVVKEGRPGHAAARFRMDTSCIFHPSSLLIPCYIPFYIPRLSSCSTFTLKPIPSLSLRNLANFFSSPQGSYEFLIYQRVLTVLRGTWQCKSYPSEDSVITDLFSFFCIIRWIIKWTVKKYEYWTKKRIRGKDMHYNKEKNDVHYNLSSLLYSILLKSIHC